MPMNCNIFHSVISMDMIAKVISYLENQHTNLSIFILSDWYEQFPVHDKYERANETNIENEKAAGETLNERKRW